MGSNLHPFRQCVGCRTARPKEELLRFVKAASSHAVFDMAGSREGRGFYLCPNETCFTMAHRNRKARAAYFRKQDDVQETVREIQETILKYIEKDLILCKKMGYLRDARSGETALGKDALVLVASDCPPEEKIAMQRAARSSKAMFLLLPAACDSQAKSCAVGTGFPMAHRLAVNLQKYEMLSSKGLAL